MHPIKLVCAVAALLVSGPVWASASLEGAGGDVSEASCVLDVRVRGVLAEVTTKQTVIAHKDTATAIYTFDLPTGAAITDLRVTLGGGRTTRGVLVDADAALQTSSEVKGARPDVAMLRMIAIDGRRTRYELRVFPVQAGRSLSWAIDWVAPLQYSDGRLVLRVPPRGHANNLVTEKVVVSGRGPAGFDGFESVVGSGVEVGKKLPARFTGNLRQGVTVELVPRSRKSLPPRLDYGTVPITKNKSVVVGSLMAPHSPSRVSKLAFDLVIALDISKSMGEPGRRAALEVVRGLLDGAPKATQVQIVLFARKARTALGAPALNNAATRAKIERAIAGAALANGSNLAEALVVSTRLLTKSRAPRHRLVVVSDTLTPLSQSPAAMVDLIDSKILETTDFAHVSVVPLGGALPLREHVATSGLTQRGAGRIMTVRNFEARRKAPELWQRLWAMAPLTDIELSGKGALAQVPMPVLSASSGAFFAVMVNEASPRTLSAGAVADAKIVRVRGRPRPELKRHALALALASRMSLPGGWTEKSFLELAAKAHVVTRHSAFVAPYPGDRFAKERFAMARKWGPSQFRRYPNSASVAPAPPSFRFIAPPPSFKTVASRTVDRATGRLDKDILARLMQTYVVPRVHGCYRQSLVVAKNLRGHLTVVAELARGEVQSARIEGSLVGPAKWAAKVEACALDAAYSIRVPTVQLGRAADEINLVRYPLRFRIVDSKGRVIQGRPTEEGADANDPLDGM